MSLVWAKYSGGLKAFGKVPYKVWVSHFADGFYATAGLECIGKTTTQKAAIQLCNNYEKEIS